ncbi:MAG TPA: hypothetical protein VES88_10265 [Gemmatimonadaceae bacterium]|nr:hypothetical protein [Gemmatimonadaceae bacterium]
MSLTAPVSRFVVLSSALLLAACADTPTSVEPPGSVALSRGGVAADRLGELFERASPAVMAIGGTVFADNDERIGKMVFGVENANAIPGIQRALAAVGASSGDYVVEVTEPIRHMADPTLRDRFRPTQAGIQIHFGLYVCTMGFNVDHSGGRSFITNSHCTNTQGGTEGTIYYQPVSSVDNISIATEADDPIYKKGDGCPRGKKCRWSDASRALYQIATASNRGDILKTTGANNGSLTVGGLFAVTSQDNSTTSFKIGTVLNKVGRTTGWSQGPVSRTCVNTNVSGSQVHQFCQTFVDANVAGGDSGSPVFAITSGDNVQLVGILWGGGTGYYVMSPLASIQKELGSLAATR